MMRLFALLIFGFLLGACKEKKVEKSISPSNTKSIIVESNPNIHTSHIIELFVWPGEYPTRPMIGEAQNYFKEFANHPAISLSDSLLLNEIYYFDELTEILLYLEDFPSTKFKYSLKGTPYEDREAEITGWITKIAAFYVDANVEGFLEKNSSFYEGANREVIKNLPPDNFVELIEDYYRARKHSYTIIPAPEMPTGGEYGTRGIGPYVRTPDGMAISQVISASLPVASQTTITDYTEFGFDNRENTLRMSYHEFGHAFVNPLFEENPEFVEMADQSSYLFGEDYLAIMKPQNYGDWLTVVQEHLVRLGEIRLAERSGDSAWADELRKYHINELKFVFLPALEEKILTFEQNSELGTFADFLPELLGVFTNFSEEDLKTMLNF